MAIRDRKTAMDVRKLEIGGVDITCIFVSFAFVITNDHFCGTVVLLISADTQPLIEALKVGEDAQFELDAGYVLLRGNIVPSELKFECRTDPPMESAQRETVQMEFRIPAHAVDVSTDGGEESDG